MTTPESLPEAGTPRRRTVLLAQPGAASDRLQEALQQAGAEVLLVADPRDAAVDAVIAVAPDSVLVALDPAIEAHLERFDAVLGDPSIVVIFDEAELAARREGWDAARWSRHLQAKLYGHDDVLPPGQTDADDDYPQPGMPALLQPESAPTEISLVDFVDEADGHAEVLPTDGVGVGLLDGIDEVDVALLEPEVGDLGAIDFNSFDIGDSGNDNEGSRRIDGNDDAEASPLAVPGLEEFLRGTDIARETAELPVATEPRTINNNWSLDDNVAAGEGSPTPVTHDIEELERRIAGLSLADADSYGHGPQRGAVVLLAGLGGPDAVRQILKGLPESFPRPVLVLQRLDGGQYDKLVGQMARASAMPVLLAAAGMAPEAGHVYVVPPMLGLARKGAALNFSESAGLLDALPANDSAVVMLSGADPAFVDPVLRLAASGALVAGQSSEGCFEPVAANDLAARGAETGVPARLAERLAERWPV